MRADESITTTPNKFKDNARGVSVDMSEEAVARRMRVMDQLWTLGNRMMVTPETSNDTAEKLAD